MSFLSLVSNTVKQAGSFVKQNSIQCVSGVAVIGLGLYLYNRTSARVDEQPKNNQEKKGYSLFALYINCAPNSIVYSPSITVSKEEYKEHNEQMISVCDAINSGQNLVKDADDNNAQHLAINNSGLISNVDVQPMD